MPENKIQPVLVSGWKRAWVRRAVVKGGLFIALAVLVLNPNLKRAVMQVGHALSPESLIQTHFTALAQINREVDREVRLDRGRHSEPKVIAKFVLKKIRYVSDYETWGNLDYWPTAEETWEKRQEDCDGRAVLAASLLRSRGFHSTALVVGLDHMWIKVDENEKDPSKPPHFVALLSPNRDFSLELREKSRLDDFLRLAKAFLHPTAFRDTSTHLIADIPTVRKAILIVAALLLCFHPHKHRGGMLAIVALGLASSLLLSRWDPDGETAFFGVAGGAIFLGAISAALFFDKLRVWAGVKIR